MAAAPSTGRLTRILWNVGSSGAQPSSTAMMAGASSGAGSPLSVAATKSAFSLFSPDRDVLGRWLSPPPPPPRREPARRAMKHGRRAQGYNDRPGVFARPAATVAFGVNPPEQRPSLPAATAAGAERSRAARR